MRWTTKLRLRSRSLFRGTRVDAELDEELTFTFVNAVLLRPLPYPASDRLVILREQPVGSADTVLVHPLNFLEWRARATSFEALALVQTPPLNVMGAPPPLNVMGATGAEQDAQTGRGDVVVLGHASWQRWFGGDPTVVGRRLAVRDGPLTIIGVAPPGLRIGLFEPDAYTPLPIDPARPDSIGSRSFQCYGRLKRGVDVEAARAEMAVIASSLARQYPLDEGFGVFVAGLHEYLVRERRPALRLLMAVVATVLAIACVNLASLLMARGMSRRGEFAVRAALGASRARLVAQLVITSLVVRATGETSALADPVRRAIGDVDPTQAVSAARTMESYVGDELRRPRTYAALVACFSALAVVLAAIGIYGLIAYDVTSRTHEIGIRLALGATRGQVFRATFSQGVRLTLAGLALGVAAAAGLRGVVSSLLFGVTPNDLSSYLLAAALLAAVALAMAALPARRASRVDPTTALRYE